MSIDTACCCHAAAPIDYDPPLPAVTLSVPLFLVLLHLATPARPCGHRPLSKYRQRRHERILAALDPREPRTGKEIAARSGLRLDG